MQITCYYYWRDLSKWTTGKDLFSMFLKGMGLGIAGEFNLIFLDVSFSAGVWNEIIAESLCTCALFSSSFLTQVLFICNLV